MRTRKQWIIVATSTRARILRSQPGNDNAASPELVLRAENLRLRNMLADHQGRTFASSNAALRSTIDPSKDALRDDTRDFVRQIAVLLEAHRLAQEFDELAVVATPRMLSALRENLPNSLRSMIRGEVPRNLSAASAAELPEMVARALADRPR